MHPWRKKSPLPGARRDYHKQLDEKLISLHTVLLFPIEAECAVFPTPAEIGTDQMVTRDAQPWWRDLFAPAH